MPQATLLKPGRRGAEAEVRPEGDCADVAELDRGLGDPEPARAGSPPPLERTPLPSARMCYVATPTFRTSWNPRRRRYSPHATASVPPSPSSGFATPATNRAISNRPDRQNRLPHLEVPPSLLRGNERQVGPAEAQKPARFLPSRPTPSDPPDSPVVPLVDRQDREG